MYDSGFTNADLWYMLDLGKQPESISAEASNITDFDFLPPYSGGILPHQLSPNSLREICSLLSNINDDPLSLAPKEELPANNELLDQLWKDTLTTQVGMQNSNLQANIASFSFSSSSGEMFSDDDGGAAIMMFQGQQGGAPSHNIPFLDENEDPFD